MFQWNFAAFSPSSPKVFCLLSFSQYKQGNWQKSVLNCSIIQLPKPLSNLKGNCISHEIMMTSRLKKIVQTELSFVFIYELWTATSSGIVSGGDSLLKITGNYRNPWKKGFKIIHCFSTQNLLLTCKYSSFQSLSLCIITGCCSHIADSSK